MRKSIYLLLFGMIFALASFINCTTSGDDDDDITNPFPWEEVTTNEGDLSVPSPSGWTFLFALKLDEDGADWLDNDFSIDLTVLGEFIETQDLDEKQIAAAKHVLEVPHAS